MKLPFLVTVYTLVMWQPCVLSHAMGVLKCALLKAPFFFFFFFIKPGVSGDKALLAFPVVRSSAFLTFPMLVHSALVFFFPFLQSLLNEK